MQLDTPYDAADGRRVREVRDEVVVRDVRGEDDVKGVEREECENERLEPARVGRAVALGVEEGLEAGDAVQAEVCNIRRGMVN